MGLASVARKDFVRMSGIIVVVLNDYFFNFCMSIKKFERVSFSPSLFVPFSGFIYLSLYGSLSKVCCQAYLAEGI